MDSITPKPLTPLTNGSVLIIGVKASNFNDDIKSHPRVILWDHEVPSNKSLPSNVKAVFFTRFIGHAYADKIVTEAKKRHITIFNPENTGIITRQVKELLEMTSPQEVKDVPLNVSKKTWGQTRALIPFINFALSDSENADILYAKASELGILTSKQYVRQFVGTQRKRQNQTGVPKSIQSKLDVSVQMLDNTIKDLTDMREFLIATCEENRMLKSKLEKFKKVFEAE